MASKQTRRRLLASLGTGAVALAGCLGRNPTSDPETSPPNRSNTATRTSTYGPTGGPDERVEREPPGSPALPASGSWSQPRFDAGNTAYNPDGAGLRDAEEYWRLRPSGSGAFADGSLFNITTYENGQSALTRRDAGTAAVESSTPLVSYGISSPPALVDDRAFVTTFVEVFCIENGSVLWRGPRMDGIQAAPVVGDGAVFVNSGGFDAVDPHIRAFDTASGDERWRYDTDSETKSTPAYADGVVYTVASDGLHAVDATSGERVFREPAAAERWTTPVVADGQIYVAVSADEAGKLLAMDASTGEVQWRAETTGVDPPVVADGTVYVDTGEGVAALAASDGSQQTTLGSSGVPLARVGDTVFVDDNATLRALDAEGGVRWAHDTPQVRIADTGGSAIYGITPVDGVVYVSARDGFHALGPRT